MRFFLVSVILVVVVCCVEKSTPAPQSDPLSPILNLISNILTPVVGVLNNLTGGLAGSILGPYTSPLGLNITGAPSNGSIFSLFFSVLNLNNLLGGTTTMAPVPTTTASPSMRGAVKKIALPNTSAAINVDQLAAILNSAGNGQYSNLVNSPLGQSLLKSQQLQQILSNPSVANLLSAFSNSGLNVG